MKFKIITLIFVLMISLTGCGAQTKENTEAESTSSVSSEADSTDTKLVYVKTQQANDKISSDGDFRFNGYEFIYNDEGELSKIVDWDGYKSEEIECEYVNSYYDNGKIKLSQRYECIDGQYTVQQELKFDENGYIYEQISYSGGLNRRAPDYNYYTYDENGNIIKDEHYYDTDEIDYIKTYKYNNKNELIESTYTKYRNLEGYSVFYHNEFGYPLVEVEYDLDKNLECLRFYSYEYSFTNSPVKVTVFRETNPTKMDKIMNSAQFPLIDVKDNDAGVFYKDEDASYVKVFKYEYLPFTELQEEILLAKKRAYIDVFMWGYHYAGSFDTFW
ncbi:MAG: hypothetical protein E7564_08045 [Ruminococcaceae bacterium]|nr:hypothetical protein [Oscillospiraceae bacterium]